MTSRQILFTALAVGHLILVAGGAASAFRSLPATPTTAPVRWYGEMSGASMGYGFFAPRVGSQLRATFALTDPAGRTWQDDLEAGKNQEVKLRIGSLVNTFPAEEQEEALRQDLLSCWAGSMFGRHPQAQEVRASVEVYLVPTLDEYRAGERPRWAPIYPKIVFRRAPELAAERKDR